jgi:hypothetical protein
MLDRSPRSGSVSLDVPWGGQSWEWYNRSMVGKLWESGQELRPWTVVIRRSNDGPS